MNEIEDRLRKGARAIYLATESIVADDVSDMMNKAADEIAALRAQLAEAVGLLKPFARLAKYADEGDPTERVFGRGDYAGNDFREITISDLRRAREFIERVGR